MRNGMRSGGGVPMISGWKRAMVLLGICLLTAGWLYAADDVKIKLTDNAGVSNFAVQDSDGTSVFRVNSDGHAQLLGGAELRLYNAGNTFYGGFKAPALGANRIWILPLNFGSAGDCLIDSDGAGTLAWAGKENALTFNAPLSRAVNTISIPQANGSTDGYLSSANWTTFNNKQNALGFTPENLANKGAASGYAELDASTLVPAAQLGSGVADSTKYLRGDRTWTAISGITSLGGLTGASQTFVNDTNVTMSSAGTQHTLGWTGTLSSLRGGTNLDTSASTGVPSISAGTWSVNAALPASLGGTALNTSASTGVPSISAGTWSVNTTLPISLGGTGQSAQTAAFNALSPLTTKGDIIVHNGTNNIRVAVGADNQVLEADSTQAEGVKWIKTFVYNQSVAAQGPGFAADTYLVGSSTAIPANSLQIGTRYHLIFDVSKTAAGTATPIIYVRFGTNGSTADTARLTFTFLAGTAAADIGTFEVWITFRAVGASAVIQGTAQCRHRLSTTGLQNQPGTTLQVTSGAFDSTVANSIIGVSVNGGASAAWTVQLVQAELTNLD